MDWLRFAVCGLVMVPWSAMAESPPSGAVTELHDCEVYTGSCTASGEETQAGRTVLRVWKIEHGGFRGQALDGARAAVLETADENLAANPSAASRAIVYLPPDLDAARREALLGWLREQALRSGVRVVAVKDAPIDFAATGDSVRVRVGAAARFQAVAIPCCGTGSCGEKMVYVPRGEHGDFVALLNEDSAVVEPGLELTWDAHGMRSVFLATFGNSASPSVASRL